MNDATWSVIKFPQENAVCAVPTSWVHNNECYWPPFTDAKKRLAIEKNELPNMDKWPVFPCIPFRNATYDTFKEADKKSKVATNTSDLESGTEEANPNISVSSRSRKIFKKTYSFTSVSEEENDQAVLPTPPKLKKKTDNLQKHLTDTSDHSSCLVLKTSNTETAKNENISEKINIEMQLPQEILPTTDVVIHRRNTTTPSRHEALSDTKKANDVTSTNEQVIKYLHQIIKKQNILQAILMDVSNRLTTLETSTTIVNNDNIENTESLFVVNENLPVDSMVHLERFETYLSNSVQMESAVKEISQIGGKDVYEFIYRATQKIITNDFCGKSFSYLGRRKKESFCKLKLHELLITASMRLFPNVTNKEVESNVMKWLRRCLDRCKPEKPLAISNN